MWNIEEETSVLDLISKQTSFNVNNCRGAEVENTPTTTRNFNPPRTCHSRYIPRNSICVMEKFKIWVGLKLRRKRKPKKDILLFLFFFIFSKKSTKIHYTFYTIYVCILLFTLLFDCSLLVMIPWRQDKETIFMASGSSHRADL